jgi:hypothetical protein
MTVTYNLLTKIHYSAVSTTIIWLYLISVQYNKTGSDQMFQFLLGTNTRNEQMQLKNKRNLSAYNKNMWG